MSKYIDAEILKACVNNYQKSIDENGKVVVNAIKDMIDIICPAAEVQEVRHGTWQPRRIDVASDDVYYRCSACGATVSTTQTPYCPNCGAMMKGGNNNAN